MTAWVALKCYKGGWKVVVSANIVQGNKVDGYSRLCMEIIGFAFPFCTSL